MLTVEICSCWITAPGTRFAFFPFFSSILWTVGRCLWSSVWSEKGCSWVGWQPLPIMGFGVCLLCDESTLGGWWGGRSSWLSMRSVWWKHPQGINVSMCYLCWRRTHVWMARKMPNAFVTKLMPYDLDKWQREYEVNMECISVKGHVVRYSTDIAIFWDARDV